MSGLDKAIGGEKLFTYLGIFRLLLSLWVQFGDLQTFELKLLIHLNQYSFVSSLYFNDVCGFVLLCLFIRCLQCITFSFSPTKVPFAEDQTEKIYSWLPVSVHSVHLWAIDDNVELLCLVKNHPLYKQTLSISHFMAGRQQHMVLLSATVVNKSHLEQRQ